MNIKPIFSFPYFIKSDFDMFVCPMCYQYENGVENIYCTYGYNRSWSCLVVWYKGKQYVKDLYTEDAINEFWDILRRANSSNGVVFINDMEEDAEPITEPYKRILSYTNGYVYVGKVPTLSSGEYED